MSKDDSEKLVILVIVAEMPPQQYRTHTTSKLLSTIKNADVEAGDMDRRT